MREITTSEVQAVSGGGTLYYDIGHVVGTAIAKFVDAVNKSELPTTSRSVM